MSDTMTMKERTTRFLQENGVVSCSAADASFNKNDKVYSARTSNGIPYQVNVGLFACSNDPEYAKALFTADGRNHLVTALANGKIAVTPFPKGSEIAKAIFLDRRDLAQKLLAAGEQAIKQGVTSSKNPLDDALSVASQAVCSIYAKPVAECKSK